MIPHQVVAISKIVRCLLEHDLYIISMLCRPILPSSLGLGVLFNPFSFTRSIASKTCQVLPTPPHNHSPEEAWAVGPATAWCSSDRGLETWTQTRRSRYGEGLEKAGMDFKEPSGSVTYLVL